MISSQNQALKPGRDAVPDTVLALRQWLNRDRPDGARRLATATPATDDVDNDIVKETSAEISTDKLLIDATPRLADLRLRNEIAREGAEVNPSDSPSISPAAPLPDPNSHQANSRYEDTSGKPSVTRRVFGIFVQGFVALGVIGLFLVVVSSGEINQDGVQRALSHLSGISPEGVGGDKAHALQSAAISAPKPSDDAQPHDAVLATGLSAELQAKIEMMAGQLADIERTIQQLTSRQGQTTRAITGLQQFAARQDQVAQQIANLQASEKDLSQRVSELSQSINDRPRSRRRSLRRYSGSN